MRYIILFMVLLFSESIFGQTTEKFKGHSKKVNAVSFSPNGELMATASDDKSVRIWSVVTGRRLKLLREHSAEVLCVDFSANGKYLVSGGKDNKVILWDIVKGKAEKVYKGHTEQVNSVKFSPEGKYIISGSSDKTINVWKINRSRPYKTLTKHTEGINDIQFSPDARYMLSASEDNTLKLWSADSYRLIKTLKGHELSVNSAVFTSDGKTIYSASSDRTIKQWTINSTRPQKSIKAHEFSVNSLALSRNDRFLFSASDDCKLKTWDMSRFENTFTFTEPEYKELKSIDLNPNDKELIVSNNTRLPYTVSVIKKPEEIELAQSNIWVLIVGISQYQYKYNSDYSQNDALRIYGFFKSPEGGALKDYQLNVLTDSEADKRNIISEISNTFEPAGENDVIIFYFSGHGDKNGLIPNDGANEEDNISYELIVDLMQKSKAGKKICIVDACYSGNIMNYIEQTEQNIDEYAYQSDIAFLLSSKENEQALGYRNLNQGVFSYFFIEGLKGSADENSDKIITITELYNYASNQVKAYTNYRQNPILLGKYNENLKLGRVK